MNDVFSYYYENGEIDSHLASVEALVKSLIIHNQKTTDFTLKDVSSEALAAIKTLLDEWEFNFTADEIFSNCYNFHIQSRSTDNFWIHVQATPTSPALWRCPNCHKGNWHDWWNTNTYCPYCGHRNIV